MILFPAIDLKDGQCVRLKLGDMDQATVFNTDPGAQAKEFEDQGFQYLHIVDLNGAFEGKPVNAGAVINQLGPAHNSTGTAALCSHVITAGAFGLISPLSSFCPKG